MLQGIPTASYGDPPASIYSNCKGQASESFARKKGRTVAITTKDMQKRRNDVKVRTTLLLAVPDEHQLRFTDDEVPTEFALMAKLSSSSDNEVKKEKESLDNKLTSLENASKNLDNLLVSQRSDKNKEGLGYSAVPPLPAQIYSPPKKDLLWTCCLSSIMLKPMIKFVKEDDCPRVIKINNTENARNSTMEYAEMYRNISKGPKGNPQNNIDDKGYWDSGCSRHMTGNVSYLSKYEPYDGGYVSSGHGSGNFTGKGIIKTGKLEFENVYFVKELKTPRQHNMYSIDLNNIVPHKSLTCLVTKALVDESMLCHRRLGHLNFKTMNKLVRNNLAKGLPSKCFKNDHTCVACFKGKLHKASCKTKTKDETSSILRNFITEIENLKDLKVKIIRCDNEEEFKNQDMNEFCTNKAEAVNTACYVQNRVLVNKSQNKTPYELFNSRIPAIGFLRPFECHVMILNTLDHLGKFDAKGDECYFVGYSLSSKAFRVFDKRTKKVEENLHVDFLENKLIKKGAGPNWLFDIDTLTNSMNYVLVVVAGTSSTNISGTKDVVSQAVKKDMSFLRYIALSNWFHKAHMETFNDTIKNSYAQDDSQKEQDCNADVSESSGISNPTATSKVPSTDQVEHAVSLTVESKILTISSPVPTICLDMSPRSSSGPRLTSEGVFSQKEAPSVGNTLTLSNRFEDTFRDTTNAVTLNEVEANLSNMETSIPVRPTPTFRIHKDHPKSQIIGPVDTPVQTRHKSKDKEEQSFIATIHQKTNPELLQVRPIGTKWVLKNKKDERGIVIRNKARLVAQGYTQEEGIEYEEVFSPVPRIEAIRLFLAYASFMGFIVYQMDVKSAFLYGTIDEEVYVMQPLRFQDPEFPERVYKVEKAILQVLQKKDGIFLSQDKYVGDILKKFGYSYVRSANTPMDKDGPDKDVELQLYRSMIGSLMYLIASRPDIMFAVCAYARHQVTPKECHLHIAQSKALSPDANEPASLSRDDRHGEAFLTIFSLDAGQDRENIAKTSAMSHESSPRVPSLDTDEGNKIKDQDIEICRLKARFRSLEDKESRHEEPIQEDAPITGGIIDIGEELGANKSTEKGSNDTEEMVNVISSMEAVNILSSGGAVVSTASVSSADFFPTAGVLTVSGSFPTVSAIFTTASVATPYTRRSRGITTGSLWPMRIPIISAKDKGIEKVTETKVPKKKKLQKQIDAQVAREMEEEFARENQRLSEQAARDFEIARIHVEEELKLIIEEKIELISELVKYQDHLVEILKYQAQQSKQSSKKEQRRFYMFVLKSHTGWKTEHFRGMTLEQITEKFIPV
nr:hypothetical protein [Tanacetum cinerariifolium]